MSNRKEQAVKVEKLDSRGSRPVENRKFGCKVEACTSSFKTQYDLNHHFTKCHTFVHCSVCGKFLKNGSYKSHAKNTSNKNCQKGKALLCDADGNALNEEAQRLFELERADREADDDTSLSDFGSDIVDDPGDTTIKVSDFGGGEGEEENEISVTPSDSGSMSTPGIQILSTTGAIRYGMTDSGPPRSSTLTPKVQRDLSSEVEVVPTLVAVNQEMDGTGEVNVTSSESSEASCAPRPQTDNLSNTLLSLIIRKFENGTLYNSTISIPVSERSNTCTAKRSRNLHEFQVNMDLLDIWKLGKSEQEGLIDAFSENAFDRSSLELILKYIHTGTIASLEQLKSLIDNSPGSIVNEYVLGLFVLESIKSFVAEDLVKLNEHASGLKDKFIKDLIQRALKHNDNWEKTVTEMLIMIQDEKMRKRNEGKMNALPILDGNAKAGAFTQKSFFYHWLYESFSKRKDSSAINIVLESLRDMIDTDVQIHVNCGEEGIYCISTHSLIVQLHLKDKMVFDREYVEMLHKSLLKLVFPQSTCKEFCKILHYSSEIKGEPDSTSMQLLELFYLFQFDHPMHYVFGPIRPDSPQNFLIYWKAFNKTSDQSILNAILCNAKKYVTSSNVSKLTTLDLFELLQMTNLNLGTEMGVYNLVMEFCKAPPLEDEDTRYKIPKGRFAKLQYVVRFPQLAKTEMLTVIRNNPYMTMELKCLFLMACDPELKDQVKEKDIPLEFRKPLIPRRQFTE